MIKKMKTNTLGILGIIKNPLLILAKIQNKGLMIRYIIK